MNRRDILKAGASIPLLASFRSFAADSSTGRRSSSQNDAELSDVEAFNYVLGTQSIGSTYQFSRETLLVEMAQRILDMGSNVLKFTMGRGYERMMLRASKAAYPETMQYLLNQGSDARMTPRIRYPGASQEPPPVNPDIRTLSELASLEPSYRRVLEMPFAYYLIWTYAFSPAWWGRGFPPEEQEKEYNEIKTLVVYLLKTFNGSGKSFYLGHWEGDWHVRPDLKTESDDRVTGECLQGMIDWLRIRQRAVDDARRETPHQNVRVYHYTEVNHVTSVSMSGRPSVTNRVLPKTNVDYVSYSTYDSLGDIAGQVPAALSYIEDRLPSNPSITGKRVFIGEYGFPARMIPEPERDRKSRQIMRIGLEWGCPFVLCWQMYNNEFKDGHENGYWLIDDKGAKQPLWHTHHAFYQQARRYVTEFSQRDGRVPTAEEFRRFARRILDEIPPATSAS